MNIYLRNLVKHLASLKSEKEIEDFLVALFTPQELEYIPKRLEIIRLLKKGTPQHLIAKKLDMGIATVTRGSRELKINHFKNV